MLHQRNPDVFFTVADDELIIMDEAEEDFFTSNAVATFVWTMLENPVSLGELVDAVVEAFDGVTLETAKADLSEFLAALRERDLVRSTEA